MREMGKMRELSDRRGGIVVGRIVVGLLTSICGTQTQAGIISHNGTIDSAPVGTGEVNVLFIGSSLAPNFQQFFEVATHDIQYAYNDISTPGLQFINLFIDNDTNVTWTGLRILLSDADFYNTGFPNPIQSPAIDPVQDTDIGPLGPGQIGFNDSLASFFGPVTLAISSITRFNDQSSGFLDSELTVQFDDPMNAGERIRLSYIALPSPGAVGASGFTMSVTPIPEPVTLALLGVGVLGCIRKRRGVGM